jgi:sugar lactone lactonase YvrE
MKIPFFKAFLSALFVLVILVAGCKKSSTTTATTVTVPGLSTADLIINLTSTTAQSGGTITDEGNGTISANGVCYSTTNKTPTILNTKTSDAVVGSGTNVINFTSSLTGLTANTTYYLRAYASNSAGTGYGKVITFTTGANISSVVVAVSTFAGNGTAGTADGTGTGAAFFKPQGITADASGNLFVSDSYNNTIRHITSAGVVTTLAGTGVVGYANGAGAVAQFYGPANLTVDAQGNTYVADFGNNVIRKITAAGVVSTYAGNGDAGYSGGNDPLASRFNNPTSVAIDGSGTMYVADRGNNVIRKITAAGVVSTFAGTKSPGYTDSTGTSAQFNQPNGVAVDAAGNVYVADQGNSAIRKITPAGRVTTIAGGPNQTDLLNYPTSLALDKDGNIFIADEGGRVLECTKTNVLYILAGTLNVAGFTNGDGTAALFSNPQAITVDANGNIYVADEDNNCIRKLTVTFK